MADDIEPQLRAFYEATGAYQAKVFESSAAYNQVIVLGGYAAFFAIWSSVAPGLPRWALFAAGALMLISLTVYVGWTVLGMVQIRKHNMRMMQEFAKGIDGFAERVTAAESESINKIHRANRWWPVVLILSGTTGLAAALLVSAFALIGIGRG